MTSEEFRALECEANSAIRKIADEFGKRIKELYDIAQEKGHYPEFGWTEGEVKEPDYDDFETEEESETDRLHRRGRPENSRSCEPSARKFVPASGAAWKSGSDPGGGRRSRV